MTEFESTTFGAVILLAEKLGATPINKHPECWECQIDEQWWIAVNPHNQARECSQGVPVEPLHCYVEFNGWPAGVFSPFGGEFAAGELANEQTFVEALQRRAVKS